MLVVLPDEKTPIDDFITKLPELQKSLLKTVTYDTKVEFTMPKFKIENQIKLNDVLKYMGLDQVFSAADLSQMVTVGQPIRVSDVTHAAAIDVDEKGTKASAVTSKIGHFPFFSTLIERHFLFRNFCRILLLYSYVTFHL